jgi:hypothetical protein
MPNKKNIWIAVAVGLAAGLYAAGAASTTGIYASFAGQTLANLYIKGNNAAGGTLVSS